jgi:hypothetical protein
MRVPPRQIVPIEPIVVEQVVPEEVVNEVPEIPMEQPVTVQPNISFSEDNCQSVNFSENKSSRLESAVSKENDSSK